MSDGADCADYAPEAMSAEVLMHNGSRARLHLDWRATATEKHEAAAAAAPPALIVEGTAGRATLDLLSGHLELQRTGAHNRPEVRLHPAAAASLAIRL